MSSDLDPLSIVVNGRDASEATASPGFALVLEEVIAADGGDADRSAALRRLNEWMRMARGAYAENTWRAWINDWKAFGEFVARTKSPLFPTTPEVMRAFVLDLVARDFAMASVRRMRSSISRVHVAAGYADPGQAELVRLALREGARQMGTRQGQARGLVWSEIAQYLVRPANTLRDLRDRALVCVAYDGSLRPEEIVGIDVEHFTLKDEGPGTLLIPASKTDPEGKGAVVPVVPSSVSLVKAFLKESGIPAGAFFRRVVGHRGLAGRLTTQSVTDAFQRVGKSISLPESQWRKLSGHSARVGSTQDLFAAGIELPAIMQQGRWKDARMPARYGERLLAERGAMMQLALMQGRVTGVTQRGQ